MRYKAFIRIDWPAHIGKAPPRMPLMKREKSVDDAPAAKISETGGVDISKIPPRQIWDLMWRLSLGSWTWIISPWLITVSAAFGAGVWWAEPRVRLPTSTAQVTALPPLPVEMRRERPFLPPRDQASLIALRQARALRALPRDLNEREMSFMPDRTYAFASLGTNWMPRYGEPLVRVDPLALLEVHSVDGRKFAVGFTSATNVGLLASGRRIEFTMNNDPSPSDEIISIDFSEISGIRSRTIETAVLRSVFDITLHRLPD